MFHFNFRAGLSLLELCTRTHIVFWFFVLLPFLVYVGGVGSFQLGSGCSGGDRGARIVTVRHIRARRARERK